MSRLEKLSGRLNTVRRRQKSHYRVYDSEVLAVKLDQVVRKPKRRKKKSQSR